MATSTNKIVFSPKSKNYSFLSNSYLTTFTIDNKEYYHVEGYYQAMKYYGYNEKAVEHIRNVASPQACRKVGTSYPVTDEQETAWTVDKRVTAVKQAVMAKFITNSKLSALLLSTEDATLIDANTVDDFWGCGKNNNGLNVMGQILMEVRGILKSINNPKY